MYTNQVVAMQRHLKAMGKPQSDEDQFKNSIPRLGPLLRRYSGPDS